MSLYRIQRRWRRYTRRCPHFLPSPALASPVGSPSSQPNIAVSNGALFYPVRGEPWDSSSSEHELKDIFSRLDNALPNEDVLDTVVRPWIQNYK